MTKKEINQIVIMALFGIFLIIIINLMVGCLIYKVNVANDYCKEELSFDEMDPLSLSTLILMDGFSCVGVDRYGIKIYSSHHYDYEYAKEKLKQNTYEGDDKG